MRKQQVCKCGHAIEADRLALDLDYCFECAKKNPKDFVNQAPERQKVIAELLRLGFKVDTGTFATEGERYYISWGGAYREYCIVSDGDSVLAQVMWATLKDGRQAGKDDAVNALRQVINFN